MQTNKEEKNYRCLNTRHRETGLDFPCDRCELSSSANNQESESQRNIRLGGSVEGNREGWAARLYVEVMEDFLHCAEWAVKYKVRDEEKYYGDLEEHYKKLESFISQLLLDDREEICKEIEKLRRTDGLKDSQYMGIFNQALDQILNQINKK